jgi:hypothetical protein
MSLIGFDTWLAQHSDRQASVTRLRDQIIHTLSVDPHAVIDDRILSQQLQTGIEFVRELLVELVALYALETRLFWLCPNGRGTVLEEPRIEDFPLSIECERCGQLHSFRREQVDVRFVSSDQLLENLRASR